MCNSEDTFIAKKIAIVAYATYPDTSPRSMRTDELAKELARKGYNVTLYVLMGGYDYENYEEETNIKVKSLGPTYFFDFNHERGTSVSFPIKVLRKAIGKYFELPSIELVFNAYKALKREKNIDLLITIGPYPLHWGTALFRGQHKDKLKNTVWVADCGDPYMGNPFSRKPFYFKYIEKWFFNKANFISIPIEEAREAYYSEFSEKIKVIPQGFRFDEAITTKEHIKNLVPTFIYAGVFYQNLRDPRPFLDYLVTLDQDFKFIVYTKTADFLEEYRNKLGKKLQIHNYIPRKQLIFEMSKADFLVNLENPSTKQSPSKLIDYGLSKRPILSLNTNSKIDTNLINQFLSGNYAEALKIEDVEQYNIKNVANNFLQLAR